MLSSAMLTGFGPGPIHTTQLLNQPCFARLCLKSLDTRPCCVENQGGLLIYFSTLRFFAAFRLAWPSSQNFSDKT